MKRVSAEELGRLLTMYESLDDLAQDISGGKDHQIPLAELWGFVKALGEPSDGVNGYEAYTLTDPARSPIVVVESDGSILPPVEWAKLKAGMQTAPAAPQFGGTP